MRRKLLAAMLLVAIIALAGFGIPLGLSVQARYRDDTLLTLSAEASSAAVAVPGSFATAHDVPELPDPARDVDVALYDVAGRRVAGEGPTRSDATVAAALTRGLAQRNRAALVVAIPISNEEVVVGAIRASRPAQVVAGRVHRTWGAMAALALAVFAATGVVALRWSRSLTAPLNRLRNDAETMGGGGELPERPPSGIEEIDTVHQALMEAGIELHQLLARERAFSADLAHQLRTPIAALRLRLESEQLHPDPNGVLIDDSLADLDRLERTIEDLVTLARDVNPTNEPHALATLVREAAGRFEHVAAASGRELVVVIEPELPFVRARAQAVRQILDVLLDNALVHGDGAIRLTARRVGTGAIVAVADEGTSILEPHSLFERRSESATGSGIGLALAQRLASAEDLRLLLANPGPGVEFHLVFGGRTPAGA